MTFPDACGWRTGVPGVGGRSVTALVTLAGLFESLLMSSMSLSESLRILSLVLLPGRSFAWSCLSDFDVEVEANESLAVLLRRPVYIFKNLLSLTLTSTG